MVTKDGIRILLRALKSPLDKGALPLYIYFFIFLYKCTYLLLCIAEHNILSIYIMVGYFKFFNYISKKEFHFLYNTIWNILISYDVYERQNHLLSQIRTDFDILQVKHVLTLIQSSICCIEIPEADIKESYHPCRSQTDIPVSHFVNCCSSSYTLKNN